jgi:putative spermidine/putrescine transport system permease protein
MAANEMKGRVLSFSQSASINRSIWMIAPALFLLIVFLLLPYVSIVIMSVREPAAGVPYGTGFTFAHYWHALSDSYVLLIIGRTLMIGVIVTMTTLLLGYPVAYHLAYSRSRWAGLLYVFVLSPLLVGVVVRTFSWLIILSRNGLVNQSLIALGLTGSPLPLVNNTLGVVIALTHVLLPFLILPLLGNLQAISPDLSLAARSLGASRARAFFRVTLPLSIPGIQAGTVLVFVLAISAYVTPAMLGGAGGRTMSVLIVQYLIESFRWPAGAALALILAAIGIIAVALYVNFLARVARRLP